MDTVQISEFINSALALREGSRQEDSENFRNIMHKGRLSIMVVVMGEIWIERHLKYSWWNGPSLEIADVPGSTFVVGWTLAFDFYFEVTISQSYDKVQGNLTWKFYLS